MNDPKNDPAAELLRKWAEGDARAGDRLLRLNLDALHRFFINKVAERDVADLIQETMVQCTRSRGTFEGGSKVRTWLLGIANNLVRRQRRDQVRRRAAINVLMDNTATPLSPEGTWQDRLLMERVQSALQSLTPDQRAAFILCELEELKGVEAAEVLGIRPGTLWRRLFDARRALRDALEGVRE